MLAQYTSGSTADYSKLSWLSSLSNAQLDRLAEASAATDTARNETAAFLSDLQLKTDEAYASLAGEYESFMDSIDRGGGRRFGSPEYYEEQYGPYGAANSAQTEALLAAVLSLKEAIAALPAAAAGQLAGAKVELDGQIVGQIVNSYMHKRAATRRLTL